MSEIVYNNDPSSPDYCPDPMVVFQDALDQLSAKIKEVICDGDQAVTDAVNTQIADIQAQINTLAGEVDLQALIAQVTTLSNLVTTLDLNENSAIVDDLLEIQSLAQAAQAAAVQAASDASAASAAATQVASDLTAFQTQINTEVSALQAAQTATNTKTESNEDRIEALEAHEHSGSVDPAAVLVIVDAQICENNKRVASAITAGLATAFANLEAPCLTTGGSDPGPGTGGIG